MLAAVVVRLLGRVEPFAMQAIKNWLAIDFTVFAAVTVRSRISVSQIEHNNYVHQAMYQHTGPNCAGVKSNQSKAKPHTKNLNKS